MPTLSKNASRERETVPGKKGNWNQFSFVLGGLFSGAKERIRRLGKSFS